MANAKKINFSSFFLGLMVSLLILVSALGGAIADRVFVIKPLDLVFPRGNTTSLQTDNNLQKGEVVQPRTGNQENVIVDVAQQSSQSVVTVSIKKKIQAVDPFSLSPFPFFFQQQNRPQQEQQIERDIGTGFVVSQDDGLVVTNKHVVSDVEAEYTLIDNEGQEHNVLNIYRDPVNDLAILQTSARIAALPLADSDEIRVGETVIAIGTALGEFRQTVTTGVVSGLGRGIQAQGSFAASERIDNLIQTDAAINPGNSGGPLLNSQGEVIGVNVAMAVAENIGFAIPINVVKESLQNFNQTGQFERPMLGVRYKLIPQDTALLNDVPQGAYIIEILPGSTAEEVGLELGDIITSINDRSVADAKGGLAGIINQQSIGETISLEVWRDGQTLNLTGNLQSTEQ